MTQVASATSTQLASLITKVGSVSEVTMERVLRSSILDEIFQDGANFDLLATSSLYVDRLRASLKMPPTTPAYEFSVRPGKVVAYLQSLNLHRIGLHDELEPVAVGEWLDRGLQALEPLRRPTLKIQAPAFARYTTFERARRMLAEFSLRPLTAQEFLATYWYASQSARSQKKKLPEGEYLGGSESRWFPLMTSYANGGIGFGTASEHFSGSSPGGYRLLAIRADSAPRV